MLKPPQTQLDHLIYELAATLEAAEKERVGELNTPEFPVVFIVGNSRCGSTLMLQWLASSGAFCYASDLLARFCASPHLATRIQQILTETRMTVRLSEQS